ncbi:MAG: hypothetical protein H7A24_03525 [Leptospiraceae bacterium]|nr:hypothetical protein [Leptospiraceae bacterium]MCP5510921.1 hypothetical protein [Leptospiraceae bacterium]
MKSILLFILPFLFFCSHTNQKDYEDLYTERVILFELLKKNPDPQTACTSSTTSAANCLKLATDKVSYPGVSDEYYTSYLLSSGAQTNYSDYCSNVLSSSTYSKATESYKECSFNCQKSYWDSTLSKGTCSVSNTSSLVSGLSGGILTCLINCSKAVNTGFQ